MWAGKHVNGGRAKGKIKKSQLNQAGGGRNPWLSLPPVLSVSKSMVVPNATLTLGNAIPVAPWRLVPQESAPPHMRKAFGTPMNNFGTFPRFPTRRFPDVSDWVSNNPWPLSMTSESRPWLSIGVSIPELR